jgi:hypothetical protein
MSEMSLQLLPSEAPRLELFDPRWDILMREAKARFGITSLRRGQRGLIDGVLKGETSSASSPPAAASPSPTSSPPSCSRAWWWWSPRSSR